MSLEADMRGSNHTSTLFDNQCNSSVNCGNSGAWVKRRCCSCLYLAEILMDELNGDRPRPPGSDSLYRPITRISSDEDAGYTRASKRSRSTVQPRGRQRSRIRSGPDRINPVYLAHNAIQPIGTWQRTDKDEQSGGMCFLLASERW